MQSGTPDQLVADGANQKCLLPNLSKEQAAIMDKVEEGYNTITKAFPGCGKTNLFSQIVLAFPNRKIVAISYNAKLVESTNVLVNSLLVEHGRGNEVNCCIKTYHGLLSSIVKRSIHNDLLFGEALRFANFAELGLQWPFRDFDMLVIDEAQDLRRGYFLLILILIIYICSDRKKLQIHFLGDERQVLYDFYPINKADSRFLTHAEELLGSLFVDRMWHRADLPLSFRIPPQIATVVNALVPSRMMVSGKEASHITDWVTLYIADVYMDSAQIVYDIVKREGLHNRGKILVLCASLNENSVAVRVVDLLVANGIPVHVERSGALAEGARGPVGLPLTTMMNDDENRPNNNNGVNFLMQNKVCFKTFCGAKGLEADIIIMLNTTELLEEQFINNSRYVALTRARKRMYIIQNASYTSQNQLNALIANPTLKQRHLRIIQKRPVKQELSKRRSQETQGSLYSKNALSCSTLFSFIDVQHLTHLLEHVCYDVLIPSLQDDNSEDIQEEKKSELEFKEDEYRVPCSNYVSDMTYSFDNNVTYFNVVNICSTTLQLALEFASSTRTPVAINNILKKLGNDMDPKCQTMRNMIHDALDILHRTASKEMLSIHGIPFFVLEHIAQFGRLAIVHDAFQGYREYLNVINKFDFLKSHHVTLRFTILYNCLQNICFEHGVEMSDLLWHKEAIGRYIQGSEPVQIKVCPAAVTSKRDLVVVFTHNATTGHDDRLSALVNALVVSPAEDTHLQQTALYVMNLFDGSLQQVRMTESEDKKESEPLMKRSRSNEDDQEDQNQASKYLKSNMIESESKHESEQLPPSTKRSRSKEDVDEVSKCLKPNDDISIQRRIPCAFLEAAIGFKTWKDDEEEEAKLMAADTEIYAKDTENFIRNIHEDIRNITQAAEIAKLHCSTSSTTAPKKSDWTISTALPTSTENDVDDPDFD